MRGTALEALRPGVEREQAGSQSVHVFVSLAKWWLPDYTYSGVPLTARITRSRFDSQWLRDVDSDADASRDVCRRHKSPASTNHPAHHPTCAAAIARGPAFSTSTSGGPASAATISQCIGGAAISSTVSPAGSPFTSAGSTFAPATAGCSAFATSTTGGAASAATTKAQPIGGPARSSAVSAATSGGAASSSTTCSDGSGTATHADRCKARCRQSFRETSERPTTAHDHPSKCHRPSCGQRNDGLGGSFRSQARHSTANRLSVLVCRHSDGNQCRRHTKARPSATQCCHCLDGSWPSKSSTAAAASDLSIAASGTAAPATIVRCIRRTIVSSSRRLGPLPHHLSRLGLHRLSLRALRASLFGHRRSLHGRRRR